MPPLGSPRQGLTLAGTPILLELIAWTAGAEIAADVVVAQVLALRRGVLLNRVELQGTFVQVWKRFRKEGFNPTEAMVGLGGGTFGGAGLCEVTHQRPKDKVISGHLELQAPLTLSGTCSVGTGPRGIALS